MARVELIYDRDCPNVAQARAELLRAFAHAGVAARWEEWERSAEESPAHVRRYGSPTILVDGKDVAPADAMEGAACCRIYAGEWGTRGSPSAEQIAVRLREASPPERSGGRWAGSITALPGAGVALLPKLACPACWPAYAALVSSLGLGFLLESRYLFAAVAGFLLLALVALGWRAKVRRGYGPLWLGGLAAVGVLAGKFLLESKGMVYGGAALLVVASIWNAWPRRAACPACAVPERN